MLKQEKQQEEEKKPQQDVSLTEGEKSVVASEGEKAGSNFPFDFGTRIDPLQTVYLLFCHLRCTTW